MQRTKNSRRGAARRSTLLGIVLGSVLTLLVAGLVALWSARDVLPELTEARLDEAQRRWQAHAPAGYDLVVSIEGAQPGQVRLSVRDGQVRDMTYNGQTPASLDARRAWTVPGMFEMLYRELELAEQQAAGSRVMLQAQFDPHYGFPQRYKRLMLGPEPGIRWTVERFEPHPQDTPAAGPEKPS